MLKGLGVCEYKRQPLRIYLWCIVTDVQHRGRKFEDLLREVEIHDYQDNGISRKLSVGIDENAPVSKLLLVGSLQVLLGFEVDINRVLCVDDDFL